MNSKTLSHTAGPWRVTFNMDEDGFTRYFITSPAGHCPEVSMGERTSNCVLIESAPLLLDTLKEAAHCLKLAAEVLLAEPNSRVLETFADCRAAIAKATGEQR